jgi:hypothetical protein
MFYVFPDAKFILPSRQYLGGRIESVPLASALFRAAASGNLREPGANLRGPGLNIEISNRLTCHLNERRGARGAAGEASARFGLASHPAHRLAPA